MSEFFQEEIKELPTEKKKGSYETGRTYTSYSQYVRWMKCPRSFKHEKIDKLGKFEQSISSIFGTAIHESIQDCLVIQYEKGGLAADSFDYLSKFKEVFLKEYKKAQEQGAIIAMEDIKEHIQNGIDILNHILSPKNRTKHFPKVDHKLVGIEVELDEELENNVKFKGFIDVVLQDTDGKIKIFDIKTSTNGWNKYQKADLLKIDQILLYKKFYSERFNVPVSDIEVQFLILKRKLYEDVSFIQSLVQVFKPLSNKKLVEETYDRFNTFIKTCYSPDGKLRTDIEYPKDPGTNKKNCTYCPFYEKLDKDGNIICDGKKEKIKK